MSWNWGDRVRSQKLSSGSPQPGVCTEYVCWQESEGGIETEKEITDVLGRGIFVYFEMFCRSLKEILIQLSRASQ